MCKMYTRHVYVIRHLTMVNVIFTIFNFSTEILLFSEIASDISVLIDTKILFKGVKISVIFTI